MPVISTQARSQTLLSRHIGRWQGCQACPLGAAAANHVFYRGTVPCDILFIGEAPGEREDMLGEPFVGRAGQVLDEIISRCHLKLSQDSEAAGFPSPKTYFTFAVTNQLCCRPPENRDPSSEEIGACLPRLQEFLALARPQHLVLLGRYAEANAPRSYLSVDARRKPPTAATIDLSESVLAWYHPAYLLRKGRAFQDQYQSQYALELAAVARNLVPF